MTDRSEMLPPAFRALKGLSRRRNISWMLLGGSCRNILHNRQIWEPRSRLTRIGRHNDGKKGVIRPPISCLCLGNALKGVTEPVINPTPESRKPKLLDQVREAIRLKHYSIRTEKTYSDWLSPNYRRQDRSEASPESLNS